MTLLLTDSDIINESFLEDISNILNTGEIPNLFYKKEDFDELMNKITPFAIKDKIPETPDDLYNYFIS